MIAKKEHPVGCKVRTNKFQPLMNPSQRFCKDVILTETLRENLQKVTDKHIPSDEVPGRRQPGPLHFEEQISDAPGKRGPNTTAAKGSDRTKLAKLLLEYINKIGGIAKVKMDYYITLLINNSDEEMQQQVDNDLSSWKNVQIEIAIAGESGSGKSSFINAVLGLTADDEGAAAVGCTETTMEVTKYVHPETQNIAFYDLPGIGTPKFPKDNYIELVNLDKYDFFLLLSQQRFKENDMWFANEIEKRNKKFFFVRTHIHKDMLASKQSHPRSHNRRKVIEEIRENIRKHLLDGGIHLKNVYIALIDNYERQDYDFEELLLKLVEKAPELKKEALIYSLSERSRGIIQMKAKFLKGRMGGIAIYASLFSLMSHENREEVMKLMFHECSLYQQQLGINTASLEIDALQLKVDKDEIVKEIKMSSYTEHDLESIFSKEWKSVPALIKRIPIVCSITCAIRTYTTCVACLKSVLELCEKDALALNAYRLSTGFK
ncbi:T-cell-specific guanine nucleotide triphosphate-binding protein 2-like isoform X3 [Mya arenaria]|uniref:T-cell-specific guanine nucleotide triphosphate-binding protein 2-like isoform X3 n=2 Tax=Mya arenaria TaxID=6604 RepID=UPI0022E8483A|nr:T-cell-specific guanine nucleotide triphosphate-binding protein 2-like isoform X3 [Mya arenaria]